MKSNGEQKMTERFCSYPVKFLMAAVLFFICFNAYAQETMQFDSEVKKLEFIRQMLKKEKYLRLSQYSAPHCKPMMEDLLANKNFKAIEPDVRADSVDDPRMAKWRQCEHKDYHDYNVDVKDFFDWLDKLGAPPYRYYKIELDGNKANGLEDMIYYNKPIDPKRLKQGDTGYTWVDLNNCERIDGFPATGWMTNTSDKPNAIYLNTLVYYKGKLWAVDFVDGFGFSLMRWLDRERIETCYWGLFKRE